MKTLVVLMALVAVTIASECGPLQRLKVKQQWNVAYGVAHNRVDFGTAIWRGLFRQEEKARDLFDRVNGNDILSGEFIAHSERVLSGLTVALTTLDDDEISGCILAHLNEQHVKWNIPANYFQLMKNSLMKVIPASIGRCFDYEAWDACLDVVYAGLTGQ